MANKSQKQMLFDSIVNSQIDDAYKAKVEANYNAWAQQQSSMPQIDNDYQAKVDADYNAWANSQKKATTASVQPKQIQSASMPAIMNRVEPTMENLKLASDRQGVWQNDFNPITVHQDKPKSDFAGTSFENGILKMYGQKNANPDDYAKYIAQMNDPRSQTSITTPGNIVDTSNERMEELKQIFNKDYKDTTVFGVPGLTRAWYKNESPYDTLNDSDKELVRQFISSGKDNPNLSKDDKKALRAMSMAYGRSKSAKEEEPLDRQGTYEASMTDAEKNFNATAGGFVGFNAPLAKGIADVVAEIPGLEQAGSAENKQYLDEMMEKWKGYNPSAYEAGRGMGQAYDYLLTSPFTGGLAAQAGLGSAGTFALDQGIQAGQDIGLDIVPEMQRMLKEEGAINWGELTKRFGYDVVMNILMGKAGDIASSLAGDKNMYDYLVKTVGNDADIFRHMDVSGALRNAPEIYRAGKNVAEQGQNILNDINAQKGWDSLRLNQQTEIPKLNIENPDDVVGKATRQAEEAVEKIEKLKKQIPIPSEDIPEIKNALPTDDLKAEIDAMNGEMENMFTTPKEAKTEPILPQIEPITNKVEIPEIKSKQPEIDPDVAANVIYELEQMGDVYYGKRGAIENTDFRIPNATINEIDNNGKKAYQIFNGNSEKPIVDRKFKTLEEAEQAKADYIAGDKLREKALKAYDDIGNAIHRYEKALFDTDDTETVTAAKRAVDAARKRYERAMKELDPGFKSELTSQKYGEQVGRPLYRRFPELEKVKTPEEEKAAQEFVESLIADENALNSNKWVKDAEPDNVIPFRGVNENVKKEGFTNPDSQKILDAYRNGDRLSQYEQDVLEMALLEDKYDNLRKYSDDIVTVEKADIPDDVLKEMIGENYDNQLDSVKLSAELAKRGFNIWENGYNNNIMANYSTMLDAVTHHLAADNIPAEIMAEAYDITYKNGGTLDDAIKLAADMAGTKLSNPTYGEGIKLSAKNVVEDTANKPKKIFEIKELHDKKGKSRYQVVERVGENMTQPVEGRKTYKSMDEANEAAYKLQFFAGDSEAPKEKWETSNFYKNTATKKGWADKLKKSDYEYRVFTEAEQRTAFKDRYKDTKNLIRDLAEKDAFDEVDMRGAIGQMDSLMEGSIDDIRKANRLGKKIDLEGREGGRLIQAVNEAHANTPSGQLRDAQSAIGQAIDQRVGKGTTEALDNLSEKIYEAYDSAGSKEEFKKQIEQLLTGDLKQHVSPKVAKDMKSKQIKGLNEIIKMLDKGESLDKIDIDKLMDVMYKANGGLTLSPAKQKEIYDLLKEAAQYDKDDYRFKLLQAKAARKVMAEVPAGLGDYVRAFLYDNMLGNFKTAFSRNFLGNVAYQSLERVREIPSAIVDQGVSKITGKRSALGWNKEKGKAYKEGFKKGGIETLSDMKLSNGVNTTRSGQTGWKETINNNRTIHNDNTKLGHWANQVDFYVENVMKLGDRPIYEANYKMFKTELEQMVDRFGKNSVAGLENVKDEQLADTIDRIAAVRAADAVFQKKGKMSEGLTKIRDGLGDLSRGAFGVDILSTASSPFTLTPGNMLERAIEYTPLGLVKNGVETAIETLGKKGFDQRRFVEEAGRSITGLPLLAGAYLGAKKGLINGGYSTDPDEKQAQIDDGFIEYGLNVPEQVPIVGGKTLDTSDLPVYGPFMQAGSVVAEEGPSLDSFTQAGEAVLGGSAMQGFRRAFGADSGTYSSQNGVLENFADTIKSSGTQLVPSLVRQTAQTTDKYKRDLGEYKTNEYYLNNIKNSIPGLRETLPIKTDVEGQPILQNQGRNIGSKIFENYVLPMNMSEYKPSPLNKEASRLLDSTDKAWAFQPKALRKDIRAWDEKAGKEYSEEQFRTYKEDLGKKNAAMGNALMQSDYYKSLDDEEKVKAMQTVYSAMKALAKETATGLKSDDKVAEAYKQGKEEGVINYLHGKNIIAKAGISTGSKAADNALELALQGKFDEAEKVVNDYKQYKQIIDENDISTGTFITSDTSKEIQSMVAAGNTEGAKQYAQQVDELKSYGLNADSGMKNYTKAREVIPSLTTKDFANTYKGMDADGKNGISQKEFLSYINSLNLSPEEAEKYLNAYGGWTNKQGQKKRLVGSSGHYDLKY